MPARSPYERPHGLVQPEAFVAGTTARHDGGVRSVLADSHALGGPAFGRSPLVRVRFHVGKVRRAWRCAVTGEVIPPRALALVPHENSAVGLAFDPFRVSLEGWGRLDAGAALRAIPPAPASDRT